MDFDAIATMLNERHSSNIVIISCLSDDEDDCSAVEVKNKNGSNDGNVEIGKSMGDIAKEVRKNDDDDDDDVIVLENFALRPKIIQITATVAEATTARNKSKFRSNDAKWISNNSNNIRDVNGDANDGEEELKLVGESNVTRLPHNRQDCLECRYLPGGDALANASFCHLCYCFVCDNLASKCENWIHGGKGTANGNANTLNGINDRNANAKRNCCMTAEERSKNHCNATDKGYEGSVWKEMRRITKNGGNPATVTTITTNVEASRTYGHGHNACTMRSLSEVELYQLRWERMMVQRYKKNSLSRSSSNTSSPLSRRQPAPTPAGSRKRKNRSKVNRRSSPHDHLERIRTQEMLEELYKT